MPTHDVQNQVPPLVDYNLFTSDRVLVEAVEREGAGWTADQAQRFGEQWGPRRRSTGASTPTTPPVLHTHDARGQRIDEVRFHPAWHALMRLSVSFGLHNLPWAEPRTGAHVARAAVLPGRPERSRPRLSDLDDLCRACPRCGARPTWPAMGTAHRQHHLRSAIPARRRKSRACCSAWR